MDEPLDNISEIGPKAGRNAILAERITVGTKYTLFHKKRQGSYVNNFIKS